MGTPLITVTVTGPDWCPATTPGADRDIGRGGGWARGTDHRAAVDRIVEQVAALPAADQPVGVGHRVVHGGEAFSDSIVITPTVRDRITDFSALAPLHNPPALAGIDAVAAAWPRIPQVAVFDTAFHQTMPPRAYRYAVPDRWYTESGVRRYGFHGTSYRYVAARAAELLGRGPSEPALVIAHLGNGCSAAAVLGGRSVDTSMGLTPMEGLVMGTRSGDVDPGLFAYLHRRLGLSVEQVTDALNRDSGLLGLSGLTNDLRELWSARADGDRGATLAIDVFIHRLAGTIAALAVTMPRLDALVFTGGIGENSAGIRELTVASLGLLGLRLDPVRNAENGTVSAGAISPDDADRAVLVVPTDEELMIARDTVRLISPG